MKENTGSSGPNKAGNGQKSYKINPGSEKLLTLAQAAQLSWLPRRRSGNPPHRSTLWRWATKGIRGIRLQTCRDGFGTCTTEAAVRDFFKRCTTELSKPCDRKSSTTASASRAATALDAAGIGGAPGSEADRLQRGGGT